MSAVLFEDVSKFYGEVLGVNQVSLTIRPGITSLVGPNGSGKTTLMNLMTGLLSPTRGRVEVRGLSPADPEKFFRIVGYCSQFDSFPKGFTGFEFLVYFLRLSGYGVTEAKRRAEAAVNRVNLADAANRKIAAYSKGMRQRIKLAQAIAHDPEVLVLDEPLNGLDPLVRAETIALFRSLAAEGRHVILSSHVLHEVDLISDQVILLSAGYVVAEGEIHGVRRELDDHPMQVLIRCREPHRVASRLFEQKLIVEARMHADGGGLLIKTTNPDEFFLLLNRVAVDGAGIEQVTPVDDDVNSVYEYLIGEGGSPR